MLLNWEPAHMQQPSTQILKSPAHSNSLLPIPHFQTLQPLHSCGKPSLNHLKTWLSSTFLVKFTCKILLWLFCPIICISQKKKTLCKQQITSTFAAPTQCSQTSAAFYVFSCLYCSVLKKGILSNIWSWSIIYTKSVSKSRHKNLNKSCLGKKEMRRIC